MSLHDHVRVAVYMRYFVLRIHNYIHCSDLAHPIVDADFFDSMEEMSRHVAHLRAFRRCALQAVMFCDDYSHVSELMQLNCGHFVHKDCICGLLRTEIGKYRVSAAEVQIVCYGCTEEQFVCDCMSCHERMDRGDNLGHIYTEDEVRSLIYDGGLSEQDKVNWDKLVAT
jgi:hypothetical protein